MHLDIAVLTHEMVVNFPAREEDKPGVAILWEVLQKAFHHESWAVLDGDGRILAIGTIYEMWKGCAECCFAIAEEVSRTPYNPVMRKICIIVKKYIDSAFYSHQLRRMQAHIAAGGRHRLRFASWLGFTCNGYLPKWGPNGENFWIVARVKS